MARQNLAASRVHRTSGFAGLETAHPSRGARGRLTRTYGLRSGLGYRRRHLRRQTFAERWLPRLALAVEMKRKHHAVRRAVQTNHRERIDVAIAQGIGALLFGQCRQSAPQPCARSLPSRRTKLAIHERRRVFVREIVDAPAQCSPSADGKARVWLEPFQCYTQRAIPDFGRHSMRSARFRPIVFRQYARFNLEN